MPQTVFITGGTRGIGRKIAESFLDKAYNVAITFEKSEEIANKEILDKYIKEIENKYNEKFKSYKEKSDKKTFGIFDFLNKSIKLSCF